MTTLSITITSAAPEGITAEVLTDAESGVGRNALRGLILGMAAAERGLKPSDLIRAGYDAAFTDGWEVQSGRVPGGRRRLQYTARPLTTRERREKLSREGGFVDNGDGSMGFVFPQPRQRVEVQMRQPKPRKVHKTPEPQVKPAELTSPERVKRPRLK
jgi:hypothetical protein